VTDPAQSTPKPGVIEGPLWSGSGEIPAVQPIPGTEILTTQSRAGRGRWLWRTLSLSIVALLLYDTATFLLATWLINPALGIIFATLFAATIGSAVIFARRELREIRKLRVVEANHLIAAALLAGNGYGRALPFIERVLPDLPVVHEMKERLRSTVLDTHSDAEVLHLFGRSVLRPLDQKAYALVSRAARDAAIGVAVSPIAALDAVIALWRSLRMIREVAETYGFRPGVPATLSLMRRLLLGTAVTATTDVVGNLWAEHLGSRLAGVLSAKLAEGVFAAIRVARLGLLAMEMCRPIPFSEDDEPSLNRLRKEIIAALARS
jgi:putative membrane protein